VCVCACVCVCTTCASCAKMFIRDHTCLVLSQLVYVNSRWYSTVMCIVTSSAWLLATTVCACVCARMCVVVYRAMLIRVWVWTSCIYTRVVWGWLEVEWKFSNSEPMNQYVPCRVWMNKRHRDERAGEFISICTCRVNVFSHLLTLRKCSIYILHFPLAYTSIKFMYVLMS
jgi:hypothetical protein